jgi:hypothetical protein
MLSGQKKIFFRSVLVSLCVVSNLALAIKIEPGVGLGVEYTDNAKLTADEDSSSRISDTIAVGYVGLNFVEKEGSIQYDVNTTLSKQVYLDDSFSDEQYFNLGASANWEMIRNRFNWFLRDRFAQRPIKELTSNTPDNLQDSNIFTFGANLNWPISSVQNFTLTPQFSQHYFEEQSTDNQQLSLAASWNYQAFRLTSMGLNFGIRNVDYTEKNTSGQSRSDTDFLNASVLFNTKFRRSNFIVDIGTTTVKRGDGLGNSGFSGSGFTGKAEWIGDLTSASTLRTSFSTELTDASSVAFSADSPENSSVDNLEVTADVVRNSLFHLTYIRDDASLNSRYWIESRKVRYSGTLLTRETQAVGLTFSRPITRLLSSSMYLKYNRTKQLETLRLDKRYTTGISLKYRMSRKMNALFDVKFRKKNSNSAADKYDETSIFVRLVYGFGDVTRPTRAGGF